MRYYFPGNVRELENILERAVALCGGEELTPEDLALHRILPDEEGPAPAAAGAEPRGTGGEPLPTYLDRVERAAILEALSRTGFHRTAAAKLLGITFRQLRYRMQRLNIREDETKP